MCALPSRRPRQLDKNSTAELQTMRITGLALADFQCGSPPRGASDGTGGNLQLLGPSGGNNRILFPRWRTLFTVPLSPHNGPTHRRLWKASGASSAGASVTPFVQFCLWHSAAILLRGPLMKSRRLISTKCRARKEDSSRSNVYSQVLEIALISQCFLRALQRQIVFTAAQMKINCNNTLFLIAWSQNCVLHYE